LSEPHSTGTGPERPPPKGPLNPRACGRARWVGAGRRPGSARSAGRDGRDTERRSVSHYET